MWKLSVRLVHCEGFEWLPKLRKQLKRHEIRKKLRN